jgi:pantoate kinase
MPEARAFAPGHLTGLFQICDQPEDSLLKGARGSGISLTRGVHTHVKAEPRARNSHGVWINGERTKEAVVSENVYSKYLPMLEEAHAVKIDHRIETPMTAGFGSSGGGALSLSLALNEALGVGLTRVQAAQIAHVAEIECRTGLGSVFAANEGGFGVLYKPGAPGVGAGKLYGGSEGLQVIYVYYGPIQTREALGDPGIRRRINQIGGGYVDELYRDLTPERFMEFSRRFTEHVGMTTPRLRRLFDAMDSEGVTFTMAMFGEVAFTVQPRGRVGEVLGLVRDKVADAEPVACDVDTRGAALL